MVYSERHREEAFTSLGSFWGEPINRRGLKTSGVVENGQL